MKDDKELIEQIVSVNYHSFKEAILESGKSEAGVAKAIIQLVDQHRRRTGTSVILGGADEQVIREDERKICRDQLRKDFISMGMADEGELDIIDKVMT